jgi:hypothetical protein
VSFGELARAAGSDAGRGDDGSDGGGSSVPAPVSIGLVSVAPEAGDPGDFLVRLEPAGGSGPLGVVELLEHFFGAGAAFAPDPRLLETQKSKAQAELPAALGRWAGPARGGSALLVRVPFSIPGDAGFESMWIEVTRVDDATVTGKLLDEPLGATDVSRGEEVRKPRAEVEAMRWSSTASH